MNKQIDEEGFLLEDYFHYQPSFLAHLVNGAPINGYNVFKMNDGTTLGDYLKKTTKKIKPWY